MSAIWKYLPILKWKRGERDALRKLGAHQWAGIVPLAEVQPPEKKKGVPPPTLREMRDELGEQVWESIPAGGAIAIDTTYADKASANQLELLTKFCRTVRERCPDHQIIPVLHAGHVDALSAASEPTLISLRNNKELMLRLRMDLISVSQIAGLVAEIKKVKIKASRIHLLVDQFSIVGAEVGNCEAKVRPFIDAALAEKCASVTVAGGSFPVNLIGVKQGQTKFARVEWNVWTELRKDPKYSDLRYGDFAVTNPSQLVEIDPTQVNPSIAIRYAASDFWRLYKGGGFKKGKAGTLKGLCQLLITDSIYSGATFSYGDKEYHDKAHSTTKSAPKNGIPWTWRRDATNHHIVLTASSL